MKEQLTWFITLTLASPSTLMLCVLLLLSIIITLLTASLIVTIKYHGNRVGLGCAPRMGSSARTGLKLTQANELSNSTEIVFCLSIALMKGLA